jgi:hypothetical protein
VQYLHLRSLLHKEYHAHDQHEEAVNHVIGFSLHGLTELHDNIKNDDQEAEDVLHVSHILGSTCQINFNLEEANDKNCYH